MLPVLLTTVVAFRHLQGSNEFKSIFSCVIDIDLFITNLDKSRITGRGSSIGNVFTWYASGPEFDPHVRHILSWRLSHENISKAILPFPLIQEEQLSVTGERMFTKYW